MNKMVKTVAGSSEKSVNMKSSFNIDSTDGVEEVESKNAKEKASEKSKNKLSYYCLVMKIPAKK